MAAKCLSWWFLRRWRRVFVDSVHNFFSTFSVKSSTQSALSCPGPITFPTRLCPQPAVRRTEKKGSKFWDAVSMEISYPWLVTAKILLFRLLFITLFIFSQIAKFHKSPCEVESLFVQINFLQLISPRSIWKTRRANSSKARHQSARQAALTYCLVLSSTTSTESFPCKHMLNAALQTHTDWGSMDLPFRERYKEKVGKGAASFRPSCLSQTSFSKIRIKQRDVWRQNTCVSFQSLLFLNVTLDKGKSLFRILPFHPTTSLPRLLTINRIKNIHCFYFPVRCAE